MPISTLFSLTKSSNSSTSLISISPIFNPITFGFLSNNESSLNPASANPL